MKYSPNLQRIPGDLDTHAEELLHSRGRLSERDRLALGRYGYRMQTIALRERSPELLRRGLLAMALGVEEGVDDPRDTMIGLSLPHVVAGMLGMSPAELFAGVAAELPDGSTKDLLLQFGARDGIGLRSFGWELVDTPDGPDFTVGPGW
ncbi:hypothetical protein [Allorhizocola rhizosphaerae]|uniref:hypothetical protein n=1 Tax=Allorhizocola rhizosphaerae TaxID=1872709 RepID=UPI000E3C3CE0|nr:hypothetical protein [Allorhizocola rhizosphaerae]